MLYLAGQNLNSFASQELNLCLHLSGKIKASNLQTVVWDNQSPFPAAIQIFCQKQDLSKKEVAGVTLRNADKGNNRAKSERSFAHFYFLSYRLGLG